MASGYIYVDVVSCDGCFACGEACTTGAITSAGATSTSGVVVGSRAEAKALRRSAARAASEPTVRQPRGESVAAAAKPVPRDSASTWSLGEAGLLAAIVLVCLFAKDAVLGSAYIATMPDTGRMVARALVLLLFYATQLTALAVLATRKGGDPWRAVGLKRSTDARPGAVDVLRTVGLVAGLLVATRLFYLLWGSVARAIGWAPPVQDANRLTELFGAGGLGLAATVALVVVVGPLAEELVFRGVLRSAFAARWGGGIALVASSAIFAVYHVTPWPWMPMFVLGLATGWLAHRSPSLWPSILLHMMYNGAVVGAAFWIAS